MDKSKIENLNPQDYTHLPHADQNFDAHEQSDVAIRPLVGTLVAIAIVIAVSMVGMWGFFQLLHHWTSTASDNQKLSSLDPSIRKVPDGLPALQGVPAEGANPNLPAQDWDVMRERNKEILAGHKGMRPGLEPGLPIEEAIDKALASGMFKTKSNAGGGAAPAGAPQTSH